MSSQGPFSVERIRKKFGLSQLEKQAIALILSGHSSEEIALRLGISEPTLRLHITNLYDKLGVSNEYDLLLYAVYHGLTEADQAPRPQVTAGSRA